MTMSKPLLTPDRDAIEADLRYMTRRWGELNQPCKFEIRALAESTQPQSGIFSFDWIDEAVDFAVSMNGLDRNIYVTRNPLRYEVSGSATDADVLAAFFCWADADDGTAAANIKRFDGPPYSAALITGKVPSPRVHPYWELAEPCTDMVRWRKAQTGIAGHFRSDKTVVNPSRIMRLAGTISYPSAKKIARGYVPEMATLRTEYNPPRKPVKLDQIERVFAGGAHSAPLTPEDPFAALDPLNREKAVSGALSGQEWHNNVIKLVASYVSRGMSDEEIHALTDRLTLPEYTVDQTRREVQTAINGARAKGWTPPPQPEEDNPFVDMDDDGENAPGWPTPYEYFDELGLAPRAWIYGRHYLRQFVSVVASAGGIGKTSMQIVEALAVATGRPVLGEKVHEPCIVWIVNLEDPIEEMQRRILAAMKHYGIRAKEVEGKLFVDAGREFRLKFAVQNKHGVLINEPLIKHMREKIQEHGIGVVMIDPFVSAHEVNENDNVAINAVVDQLRAIADEADCSISIVHHVRKGNGQEHDIDSVRGAGSLIGAARAARVINRLPAKDASALGIPSTEARLVFRVDDGKANLAPPASEALYRKMVGVELLNGDWVGVATPYELPDEWAGMSEAVVNDMLATIDKGPSGDGEDRYSIRPQDKDRWVGNVILDWPFDDEEHKKPPAMAKAIIRTWLEKGVLEEIEYRSALQRKPRQGVISTGRVGDV